MDVLENARGPDCRSAHTNQEREQGTMRGQEGDLRKAGANGGQKGGHETQDDVGAVVVGLPIWRNGVEEAAFKCVTGAPEVRGISRSAGRMEGREVISVAGIADGMGKVDKRTVMIRIPFLKLWGQRARR